MEVTTLDNTESRKLTLLSVGDPQVGKTTILDKYCLGLVGFQRVWSTQTVDVHTKMLHCPRGLISAEIFDVAGDAIEGNVGDLIMRLIAGRRSHNVTDLRYSTSVSMPVSARPPVEQTDQKAIHGVLFWFDVSNKHSFKSLSRWATWVRDRIVEARLENRNDDHREAEEISRIAGETPVFILGNKLDKIKDKLAGRTCDISLSEVKRYHELLGNFRKDLEKRIKYKVGENLTFTSKNEEHTILDDIILNLYDLNSQQNKGRAFLFHLQSVQLSSLAGPDPKRIMRIPSVQSMIPAFKQQIAHQTKRVIKAIWRQGSRYSPDRARSQSASRRIQAGEKEIQQDEAVGSPIRIQGSLAGSARETSPEHEGVSPTLRHRTKTRSKSMLRQKLPTSDSIRFAANTETIGLS